MVTSYLFSILVDSILTSYTTAIQHGLCDQTGIYLRFAGHTYRLDSVTSLHEEINNTWKSAPGKLKWVPAINDLAAVDGNLPPKLLKFLTILTTGRPVCSKRMERLVHSFGQEISRAATSGACKQPKHVLLCITLRHLFRSEKLINILNRFGHCQNYSFSLEL